MTAPAQVITGTMLVPLRFISEPFDCDVTWGNNAKTAIVILEGIYLELIYTITCGMDYISMLYETCSTIDKIYGKNRTLKYKGL